MSRTDDDIIVCRCEDVTLGEIRRAISEGATTMDEIRRITRGDGSLSRPDLSLLIASELARKTGRGGGRSYAFHHQASHETCCNGQPCQDRRG